MHEPDHPHADNASVEAEDGSAPAQPPLLTPGWLGVVLGMILLAGLAVHVVGWWAEQNMQPGPGYRPAYTGAQAFFRWDSFHYRSIARDGYAYNGDPYSTPNIVFAPVYPLQIRLLAAVSPLDHTSAGFWVARLDLVAGCILMFLVLRGWFGTRTAVICLAGLLFSAGSFAFFSYYSEATMLAWLAAAFFCLQRRWYWALALAAGVLSATRLTAGPFCLVFALYFVHLAWQQWRCDRRDWRAIATRLVQAPLCLGGMAAYLGYIWYRFGNPFVLFPEIQQASWQYFHKPMTVVQTLTGSRLFAHAGAALERGEFFLTDIKAIGLIWTCLGMAAAVYCLIRIRPWVFALGFVGYTALIYYANAGSEHLNSTHRYFVLMLPIFIMASDLFGYVERRVNRLAAAVALTPLAALDLAMFVVCAACFYNGQWYWF